jgi:hypothetical protein
LADWREDHPREEAESEGTEEEAAADWARERLSTLRDFLVEWRRNHPDTALPAGAVDTVVELEVARLGEYAVKIPAVVGWLTRAVEQRSTNANSKGDAAGMSAIAITSTQSSSDDGNIVIAECADTNNADTIARAVHADGKNTDTDVRQLPLSKDHAQMGGAGRARGEVVSSSRARDGVVLSSSVSSSSVSSSRVSLSRVSSSRVPSPRGTGLNAALPALPTDSDVVKHETTRCVCSFFRSLILWGGG